MYSIPVLRGTPGRPTSVVASSARSVMDAIDSLEGWWVTMALLWIVPPSPFIEWLPKESIGCCPTGQRLTRVGRRRSGGREKLTRRQSEGAAAQHGGGEAGHDRMGLYV